MNKSSHSFTAQFLVKLTVATAENAAVSQGARERFAELLLWICQGSLLASSGTLDRLSTELRSMPAEDLVELLSGLVLRLSRGDYAPLSSALRRVCLAQPSVTPVVPLVGRNEDGSWLHPAINWVREEDVEMHLPLEALGFSWDVVEMEVQAEDLHERYCDGDRCLGEWTPSPPAGHGWFLTAIFETERGCVALFARWPGKGQV